MSKEYDESDGGSGNSEEDDYILASISDVGFVDPYGIEGALVLKSNDGKVFHMRAFSGEVARHIDRFRQGDKNSIPTIYNLVNEIAEMEDLLLTEIRVYPSGSALRANLYFRGKNKSIILRNYRASDSIALAAYYDIPIKVKKDLFYDELDVEKLR
ncbi:MAG: hypothetical protein RMJ59_01390 [Candidatus Nitrosocaldus sp.]|nr:DUF151 domain-containing protein [Candidatus Nitrosocaldus sp.]MDW7999435.1 hypothetical protein [Candidatus Nitrosocaldus sp.]MDW8275019.1 hypothetical protein [Candidatus Nitrosocaldus sp.]